MLQGFLIKFIKKNNFPLFRSSFFISGHPIPSFGAKFYATSNQLSLSNHRWKHTDGWLDAC
jgi:hypothetical protein